MAVQMLPGQMQIDSGVPDIGVAEQFLDAGQIGPGFQQMRGIGVPQGVRINLFPDAGTLGGFLAGMPDDLVGDRHVHPAVIHDAGK